jgi:hypothetical protein
VRYTDRHAASMVKIYVKSVDRGRLVEDMRMRGLSVGTYGAVYNSVCVTETYDKYVSMFWSFITVGG